MNFSDWWQDKRYLHERKLVVGTTIALVALSLIFGLLEYFRPQHDEPHGAYAPPSDVVTPLPPPKTGIELAMELVMGGRLVEAEEILNAQELQLLRLRGAIAWKKNNLSEAERYFRAAVEMAPTSVPDLCNLAGIQIQGKDMVPGIANLRLAHELSPGDSLISNRLLLARIQIGETDRVAQEISSALESAPETSLALVAVAAAAVELKRGNVSQAVTFLHAAQEKLEPEIFESLLVEEPLAAYSSERALSPFYFRHEQSKKEAARPASDESSGRAVVK